ncbi:hypothetical protein [Wolbachia pipientis]|nr:hypothetical protein [Wolbachia pipientis]MDM8335608.1 hypothetical protein [Wolbachia pipientis]
MKGTKSLYDGDWDNRVRRIPDKPPRVIKLTKLQQGKCGHVNFGLKMMIS